MDVISRYRIASAASANAENCPGSSECLLVVLGSSTYDLDLIHAGKQLAETLYAPWIVVCVQNPGRRILPDQDRDRRRELARIAETLGAEAVTLHGMSAARTIAAYARLRRATKILLGSPARFGWHAVAQHLRVATLRRLTTGIEVIALASRPRDSLQPGGSGPTRAGALRTHSRSRWGDYVWAVIVTALCTIVAFPIAGHVDLINIVMIYLLGAAAAGLILGRGPSTLTAVTNTLAFDFFFVPPIFSFLVIDSTYVVTFSAMLVVALIIANLIIALREQTEAASAREHHTAALYAITRDLSVERETSTMVATAALHIGEALHAHACVLLCNEAGALCRTPSPTDASEPAPAVNLTVAQWVAASRERAGMGTLQFSAERARYLPLRGSQTTIGVLVVGCQDSADVMSPEQLRLLDAIANQLALALERERLAEVAHAAHLAAERAVMRNTLLASISHDLRTPLSAIAGAGSIVAQSNFALDIYRRVTLGRLIEDKARDMTDLLTNVLELVRLESGADVLSRDWYSLSDLIGLAITRHESRLTGWRIKTDLPADLPLLYVDSSLMVQLLSNLLENVAKYTPPGTRVCLSASRDGDVICLAVEDSGPGLGIDAPDRLFEKFARGRVEDHRGGIGLGLAICRAVARLHGGDIRAAESALGGARFVITVPHVEEPSAIEALPPIV
jgi:two-component system sensor histidine kinase KdpD